MNRLAPSHMASLIMGVWFFASATGNFAAGLIAAATGAEGVGEEAGKAGRARRVLDRRLDGDRRGRRRHRHQPADQEADASRHAAVMTMSATICSASPRSGRSAGAGIHPATVQLTLSLLIEARTGPAPPSTACAIVPWQILGGSALALAACSTTGESRHRQVGRTAGAFRQKAPIPPPTSLPGTPRPLWLALQFMTVRAADRQWHGIVR